MIRIAHSPDADDAFMFYALTEGLIDTRGLEFENILEDIESLNKRALEGVYELTAISFHVFAYVQNRYTLLTAGASIGDGYGPIVVSKKPLRSLKSIKIAIPGRFTSAYLALKLYEQDFEEVFAPFDKILELVINQVVDAGVLIHEAQLSYEDMGLFKVVDLGEWWKSKTGLVLPLGANAARRDLGLELIKTLDELLRESINYALSHRDLALNFSRAYAREIKFNKEKLDRFVGMYVNRWSLECSSELRASVREFLNMGASLGIVPSVNGPIFFDEELDAAG
ncbi:MAG: ABC transporter substrate-binding protein [Aquificaceae bacterium]|nr:ABC transporter substrate-binding protein [Aquificaceae bacterium]MDW8237358.1 MqnA/MqnD/SBP family protein [Aquificaceae bacterium]